MQIKYFHTRQSIGNNHVYSTIHVYRFQHSIQFTLRIAHPLPFFIHVSLFALYNLIYQLPLMFPVSVLHLHHACPTFSLCLPQATVKTTLLPRVLFSCMAFLHPQTPVEDVRKKTSFHFQFIMLKCKISQKYFVCKKWQICLLSFIPPLSKIQFHLFVPFHPQTDPNNPKAAAIPI